MRNKFIFSVLVATTLGASLMTCSATQTAPVSIEDSDFPGLGDAKTPQTIFAVDPIGSPLTEEFKAKHGQMLIEFDQRFAQFWDTKKQLIEAERQQNREKMRRLTVEFDKIREELKLDPDCSPLHPLKLEDLRVSRKGYVPPSLLDEILNVVPRASLIAYAAQYAREFCVNYLASQELPLNPYLSHAARFVVNYMPEITTAVFQGAHVLDLIRGIWLFAKEPVQPKLMESAYLRVRTPSGEVHEFKSGEADAEAKVFALAQAKAEALKRTLEQESETRERALAQDTKENGQDEAADLEKAAPKAQNHFDGSFEEEYTNSKLISTHFTIDGNGIATRYHFEGYSAEEYEKFRKNVIARNWKALAKYKVN